MKLTSIELRPEYSSEVVMLSFRDPGSLNEYNIKGITGLDADEITPKYYGSSQGLNFNSLSLLKRDIVFRIGLNPNPEEFKTYSDLRDLLYSMISSSRTGKLQVFFKNGDEIVATILGFISKFETPLFEKTQEVQLTVKCDEPMLKALDLVSLSVDGFDSNNFDVNDTKSTAPHGFRFVATITSDLSDIIISDPNFNTWSFQIVPAGGFLVGDVLYFSSEYNNKYLYIVRDDEVIFLADVIALNSIWPILFPGSNTFSFSNPQYVVLNEISYFPTYWGV